LAGRASLPSEVRDRFEKGLLAAFPDAQILGHPTQRLPNTVCISFKGVDAASMLHCMPDVAVSTGSACESGTSGTNYVLRAMGVGDGLAAGMVRFSLGRCTTEPEIDYTIEQVRRCATERHSISS